MNWLYLALNLCSVAIPLAFSFDKRINYDTVIQNNLRALDQSAVLLARDHNLPIHVFNFDTPEIMGQICKGEDIGTLIGSDGDILAE